MISQTLSMGSLAIAALALASALGACGGSRETPTASPLSAEDDAVSSLMYNCFDDVMREVAGTSGVDTATLGELNSAMRITLSGCASAGAASSAPTYTCGSEGCYDSSDNGYSWESTGERWACRNLSSDHC